MDIKRAKQEIINAVEAYFSKDEFGEYKIPTIRQRPILLMGPPGIGKTQIMEQVARECDIGLVSYTITHHTRQSAVGLPFIKERVYENKAYSVTEYTMSEILSSVYEAMERTKKKEGILFLDEINCVSETLAPTMLQFLQCKTFGNQKLPEGWMIVAAGNPPEYNKSVREFDVVTLDRVKRMEVEENYEAWKEYAHEVGIHESILSYLEVRKGNFYKVETTVDGMAFVTARGWEDLSQILFVYEELEKKIDAALILQYLQHEMVAKDFASYLELYKKYKKDYGLEQILEGVYGNSTLEKLRYASFDERLSVVNLLYGKLENRFRAYKEALSYIESLHRIFLLAKEEGLRKQIQTEWDTFQEELQQELLSKEERIFRKKVLQRLEEVQSICDTREEEEYAGIQSEFSKDLKVLEEMEQKASTALAAGFDFMESAFGDGQEMVVFVTNLNSGFYSRYFLKDHDCDKYFQYNKGLLLEETERKLKEKIKTLE